MKIDCFGFLLVEGGEKDHIFDSLKNITKLPSSPPKGDDRLDDSAVQTVGSRTTGEGKIQEENLGEKPPWIVLVNVVQLSSSCFLLSFADSLAFFSDKQAEDQPKSPAAASIVDRVLQETP